MTVYPYGSWPSPISAADMASGATRISGLAWRSDGLWWSESRPADKGRVTLVRSGPETGVVDVASTPWSVRSSVHEYGGGSWWLGSSCAYFVNWDDQRIYRVDGGEPAGEPQPVTADSDNENTWRFADGDEHPDTDVIVAVRETHSTEDGHSEPINELVCVDVQPSASSTPAVVASGADFYAAPRFSSDGRYMSWIQWNHPQMPWDGTELCVAEVNRTESGLVLGTAKVVAGGQDTAIMGADWTTGGQLVFSNDRSGFWNLERYQPDTENLVAVTQLSGAEIGAPQWIFGTQQWIELSTGDLAVVVTKAATDSLSVVPASALSSRDAAGLSIDQLQPLSSEFTRVDELVAGPDGDMYVSGLTADGPSEIALVAAGQARTTVHQPGAFSVSAATISKAKPIEFASGGQTAHAFFYPPVGSVDGQPITPTDGELPPLLVMGHGGPTSHSAPAFGLKVQFWTSRGFAVADVNYRGSTGFGREYRRMLNGQWGLVDVEDCIAVAEHLAAEGFVDRERMAIRGGSAGGFTVLRALETSTTFGAGTSLYGVADLEALATDTHKFESRYLDSMIGPYPQRQDLYQQRSPINHTDGLNCPLLVLQGTEDKVVPPSQSEAIVAAVADKGLPHAYIAFEGEQHGFRQAETIVRSFEAELWFYGQVFGFDPADEIAAPSEAVGFD